jgi:hypothetical protein
MIADVMARMRNLPECFAVFVQSGILSNYEESDRQVSCPEKFENAWHENVQI